MLSRVADALFWMSRYIERSENTARFIDVNIHLLLDLGLARDSATIPYWQALLDSTNARTLFEQHYPVPDGANVCHFLTFNSQNPNSILACVTRARENARSVRDSIASEMWEQINQTYWLVRGAASRNLWADGPHAFYTQIKQASHLFRGICDATLNRTEAWYFIDVAKHVERADDTTRLLDVKCDLLATPLVLVTPGPRQIDHATLDIPAETVQWVAVLKSCSAYEAYRRYYVSQVEPRKVIEFLLLSDSFPRSVLHCIQAAHNALSVIAGDAGSLSSAPLPLRRLGRLQAQLSYSSVDDVVHTGLRTALERIQNELNHCGEEIGQTYLHGATLPVAHPAAFAHAAAILAHQQQ